MRHLLRIAIITCLASAFGFGGAAMPPSHQHAKHAPSGWQPGGPLRPIFQSAVKAIHSHDFETADELCNRGLRLAPGDKAFVDLQGQIPQWQQDTNQADIATRYQSAIELVHQGKLDDAEIACNRALKIEPDNASFIALLKDIDSRRNVALQNYLLKCYHQAARLMNAGEYEQAKAKCREGLKRQPGDVELVALMKRIRARENGDE